MVLILLVLLNMRELFGDILQFSSTDFASLMLLLIIILPSRPLVN